MTKKISPHNKNNKLKIVSKNENIKSSAMRLKTIVITVLLLFMILIGRIVYIEFFYTVDGKKLKEKAYLQSTQNKILTAKRGTIFDRNGKTLALSADVDTITVNPAYLKVKKNAVVDQVATNEKIAKIADKIVELFGADKDTIINKLKSNKPTETLVSKVEKTKIDELTKWLKDNKYTSGINIDPDTKRYYPYNNLASHVIGFVGSDNQGLEGIENRYDVTLRGKEGRLTTAVDVTRDEIPDNHQEYIAPENGSNVYLTIDSNIQIIAEKYLKQAVEESKSEKGGNVIIMNPTNGDILAMATYPDYNLNTPMTITTMKQDEYNKLSTQEQTNKLYQMWRNRAVVDTYEPGSTFKTITAAIALEENLAKTDTPGDFNCIGYEEIANTKIRCTAVAGHGKETLRQALENSCNPALMQLGRRIGAEKFYKYLKAFGMFESTGIDLPSEGNSTFWPENKVGPIELATMSFGQRFKITPIQMVRAASALANNGELVTPRLVKQIENTNTGTITETKIDNVRKVVSKETSDKIRDMMHSVVENGGGRNAQVKGYEIGGKTGTSEADPNHPEEGYVSSFLAIAPVENTKLTVLLTLYKPQVKNHYGGHIAAPAVAQMLSEILPYLNIPSNISTDNVQSANITVPNVTNKKISDVKKQLKELKLQPDTKAPDDEIVKEQVPPSGTKLMENGIVKLYTNEYNTRVSKEVPNLKGKTLQQAKAELESRNLNISAEGTGIIISQEITSGKQVDEGTVIRVKLQEKISNSQH